MEAKLKIFRYYHQETVKTLAKAVAGTHLIFCWVRKWSQMAIVFIREPLVAYTSCLSFYYVGELLKHFGFWKS